MYLTTPTAFLLAVKMKIDHSFGAGPDIGHLRFCVRPQQGYKIKCFGGEVLVVGFPKVSPVNVICKLETEEIRLADLDEFLEPLVRKLEYAPG